MSHGSMMNFDFGPLLPSEKKTILIFFDKSCLHNYVVRVDYFVQLHPIYIYLKHKK